MRPRRLLLRSAVTAEELTALDLGPAAGSHYASTRVPHAARVQRTARTWGDIWHVSGVGALLRDELFRRRPADVYRYTDWLYGPVRPSAL